MDPATPTRPSPAPTPPQAEEFITLADPKLSLFTGEEEGEGEMDVNELPQHKITNFT